MVLVKTWPVSCQRSPSHWRSESCTICASSGRSRRRMARQSCGGSSSSSALPATIRAVDFPVLVAGELATLAGITGWSKGDATASAEACFRSWLQTLAKSFRPTGRMPSWQMPLFPEVLRSDCRYRFAIDLRTNSKARRGQNQKGASPQYKELSRRSTPVFGRPTEEQRSPPHRAAALAHRRTPVRPHRSP